MQSIHKPEVTLSLQADLIFLPVATSFVEKAAVAFGLAEPDALSLTLATEEIFAYLSGVAAPRKEVVMKCRSGGYYVDQEFLFEAQGLQYESVQFDRFRVDGSSGSHGRNRAVDCVTHGGSIPVL